MNNLINWSEVSRLLTNDRTSIRSKYSGKMYKKKVNRIKQIEKALKNYLEFDRNIDNSILDAERTEPLRETLKDITNEI